jgi:DNA-binding beta-propeller fold protein YncE
MRYIPVGNDPEQIEAPHQVRVSPDGQYWYAVFYSGSVLQKFRTSDDSLVATFNIGFGDWNTIIFTPDGTRGFVNGTNINTTAVVDLVNNTVITQLSPELPHGGFVTPDGHWLYLTSQVSNFINKVDLMDPGYSFDAVILQPGEPKLTTSRYDPHEATLSPDGTKYFVSCQTSNEIRVFRLSDDSLLKVIPVGAKPQEFAESRNNPYLFVSCTEAIVDANRKGQVYIINYNTLDLVDSIYTGYQPHGIDIDQERKLVYVANLNLDNNGPAPHHVSDCGGRNGYITIIDERTLELYRRRFPDGSTSSYKNEVLRAPYFVSYRKRP